MLKPLALRPGGLIGIIAPASPVKKKFVDAGLEALEKLGFRSRLGTNLFERGNYTAGKASERIDDLVELWRDPEVDAIFCARGGYGSMELLRELDAESFRSAPKIFLGSSDITALLGFLGARCDLITFYGPMLAQQMARGAFDAEELLRTIQSTEGVGSLTPSGTQWLHPGAAEGRLWGGCLSIIAALVGTPYLPSFDDALLFLEDTHVKPYQIDRLLTQLRLSGRLETVRGIVFGQMPNCAQHPDQGYTLEEMLREWTAPLGIPVLFGFPSGHTTTDGLTLPLGIRARLDSNGLHLLEGAVA